MTIGDLSVFCRLCLMPLVNGSYIDCALEENKEFKDTIKTVYNIDINAVDEFSTKVCLMCCDVLMYNTIHYHRAVEAQKSLTRVQRIKNKLRKLGKKKTEKKSEKQPLPDSPIIDVEMIEVEPICPKLFPVNDRDKVFPVDDCEMEVSGEVIDSGINSAMSNVDSNPPMFFANLTSFEQNQWPTANHQLPMVNMNGWNCQTSGLIAAENGNDMKRSTEIFQSPLKPSINKNVKQSPSFFQMAKTFCGNIMKKHKTSVELGLDEITNQMALLRFTA